MLAETSRYVPGTDNAYSVTDDGRIYSHSRVCSAGRLRKGRWLKPYRNEKGYLVLANPINGERKVHRIVALTFLGEPVEDQQVNQKNGNKEDNRVSNLEWVSPSENIQHSWAMGQHKLPVLECAKCGKLIRTKGGLATHYKACD